MNAPATPFAPLTEETLEWERNQNARVATLHLVRGDTDLALARAKKSLAYDEALMIRVHDRLARYGYGVQA